ncbi:hypothetical protein RAS2_16630 [Phycisphaerae bacterium RAS2]|nr:hypothetical protein RAS2_16630 [Phycisphaerae bacterium RAS2]
MQAILQHMRIGFLTFGIVLASTGWVNADLVVERLQYLSRVSPTSSPSTTQSFFLEFPASPQNLTHTAQLGDSSSQGDYAASWSGDSAEFDIAIGHRLTGFEGSTTSTGTLMVRPSTTSIFSVSGALTYNHPATALGSASLFVTIRLDGTPGTLFTVGDSDGTFGLGPPTGTIPTVGSFELQAGNLYRISYVSTTANYDSPPPGAEWLGNGEVHIAINPVPEPATLALLATAIPFLIHRRRFR